MEWHALNADTPWMAMNRRLPRNLKLDHIEAFLDGAYKKYLAVVPIPFVN